MLYCISTYGLVWLGTRIGTYSYSSARLCRARLAQAVGGRVTPFRGFLRRRLVLLQARDVLLTEVQAVGA